MRCKEDGVSLWYFELLTTTTPVVSGRRLSRAHSPSGPCDPCVTMQMTSLASL